jgi:pimeloyl-ACP methyl ester carboxylesterase
LELSFGKIEMFRKVEKIETDFIYLRKSVKTMRKFLYIIAVPVLLAGIYLAGPKYTSPVLNKSLPEILLNGDSLGTFVRNNELKVAGIKEDNEARIIWANDSLKNKTPFAVVYLHGFSASQGEGTPIHTDFAKRYGCNLFLSRLYAHGINSNQALIDMTPENLVNSAKEAIAIGKKLGEKVILMSTSTGGTLSLYLAGGDPDIAGIILYSPNIQINNPFVKLVTGPWGLRIGRLFAGGENFNYPVESREDSIYWNKTYRVEAVMYLQTLVDLTMNKTTFAGINQPVFLGYYFKDEKNQDPTVKVDAMLEMFNELGTRENKKMKQAFPEAGKHVIGSKYKSGDWKGVESATFKFAEEILGLKARQEGINQ